MTRPKFQEAASAHLKAKFSPYVKRQRAEHEAPPLAVPVMSRDWPPYVPATWPIVREAGKNHLNHLSRGV